MPLDCDAHWRCLSINMDGQIPPPPPKKAGKQSPGSHEPLRARGWLRLAGARCPSQAADPFKDYSLCTTMPFDHKIWLKIE